MSRIDERDTMFARMSYSKNGEAYEDYYGRHPEKKDFDDYLRTLPQLCGEGTMAYHPVNMKMADAMFGFLGDINHLAEGDPSEQAVEVDPKVIAGRLKKLAKYLGAVEVGVTEMKDEFYYSYRGRKEECYGDEVKLGHKYAIVFAVEMDKEFINRAPFLEEVVAVSKGYLDAAIIGMALSYFIRELGYPARNHMDGNYLCVAPLVGEAAGLGQIGRMGVLCTRKYGPRVRLGVVTTDLELALDDVDDFGFPEFCEVCGKCVKTCPGQAIPKAPREVIDGSLRWRINQEKCYERWRSLGTDCGVCLSSCPFSQGVDQEVVDSMKGNHEVMMQILRKHEERYGVRNFIKTPLDLVLDE